MSREMLTYEKFGEMTTHPNISTKEIATLCMIELQADGCFLYIFMQELMWELSPVHAFHG